MIHSSQCPSLQPVIKHKAKLLVSQNWLQSPANIKSRNDAIENMTFQSWTWFDGSFLLPPKATRKSFSLCCTSTRLNPWERNNNLDRTYDEKIKCKESTASRYNLERILKTTKHVIFKTLEAMPKDVFNPLYFEAIWTWGSESWVTAFSVMTQDEDFFLPTLKN